MTTDMSRALLKVQQRIVEGDPDSCWAWDGRHDESGYARLGNLRVSRVLLNLTNPKICARHRCDNPPCVNPAHLVPGTHAQNMADMRERGRQPRGELRHNAKLTAVQINAIRADPRSARQLGPIYGVHAETIVQIKRGRSWTHVPVVGEVSLPTRHRFDGLSKTQAAVLQGMADGLTNVQIGERLGIRPGTVAKQSTRLFAKLQVDDRAHAVRAGFQHGYLRLDAPVERAAS